MDPYQPPSGYVAPPPPSPVSRGLFTAAASGAFLASAYWALMTLLIGFGAANGSVSPVQLLMPCVLIGLYAVRGYQIWQGDVQAARRIITLHAVGGVVAIMQVMKAEGTFAMLQMFKVAIHVFGGLAALMVVRAASRPRV